MKDNEGGLPIRMSWYILPSYHPSTAKFIHCDEIIYLSVALHELLIMMGQKVEEGFGGA